MTPMMGESWRRLDLIERYEARIKVLEGQIDEYKELLQLREQTDAAVIEKLTEQRDHARQRATALDRVVWKSGGYRFNAALHAMGEVPASDGWKVGDPLYG
jgi:hypothetical protein